MKKTILIFITTFFLINMSAHAQVIGNIRRNVATIIFCGLGGAVLGLSTLSFYGEPQEHVGNITTGLALGLIGGTIYVTSQAGQESNYSQLSSKFKPLSPSYLTWNWEF